MSLRGGIARLRVLAVALLVTLETTALQPGAAVASPGGDGLELIGRPAPPLDVRWVDTRPELRGRAVLVRWFTGGCPYCARTLPYLTGLAAQHRGKLVVVGVYHPKPRALADDEVGEDRVREVAAAIGLRGAVLARDPSWKALRRWWLDGRDRAFTSVSFLVDARGKIRWVHPGGEYHPAGPGGDTEGDPAAHADCHRAAAELERILAGLSG